MVKVEIVMKLPEDMVQEIDDRARRYGNVRTSQIRFILGSWLDDHPLDGGAEVDEEDPEEDDEEDEDDEE
jgi:hypothetical protein